MKKCAILTINVGIMNYGNRLQNYALQRALEKLDCTVETINYHLSYPAKQKLQVNKDFGYWINKMFRGVKHLYVSKNKNIKKEKFQAFVNDYINWSQREYDIHSDLKVLDEDYDYFIC